jgi:hypothetical protein
MRVSRPGRKKTLVTEAVDELYMERFRQWNSSDTRPPGMRCTTGVEMTTGRSVRGSRMRWETSRPAFTQHDGELPTRDAGSPGAHVLTAVVTEPHRWVRGSRSLVRMIRDAIARQ